jgi:hypothetical protein
MSLRSKLRLFQLKVLNDVQVASPCSADWDAMEGDEKVRFCGECRLHVFNLSAMDLDEAAEKVSQASDRLCVRFFRRHDGTIMTRDCPVGVERKARSRRAVLRLTTVMTGASVAAAVLYRQTVAVKAKPTSEGEVGKLMTPTPIAVAGAMSAPIREVKGDMIRPVEVMGGAPAYRGR